MYNYADANQFFKIQRYPQLHGKYLKHDKRGNILKYCISYKKQEKMPSKDTINFMQNIYNMKIKEMS